MSHFSHCFNNIHFYNNFFFLHATKLVIKMMFNYDCWSYDCHWCSPNKKNNNSKVGSCLNCYQFDLKVFVVTISVPLKILERITSLSRPWKFWNLARIGKCFVKSLNLLLANFKYFFGLSHLEQNFTVKAVWPCWIISIPPLSWDSIYY